MLHFIVMMMIEQGGSELQVTDETDEFLKPYLKGETQ